MHLHKLGNFCSKFPSNSPNQENSLCVPGFIKIKTRHVMLSCGPKKKKIGFFCFGVTMWDGAIWHLEDPSRVFEEVRKCGGRGERSVLVPRSEDNPPSTYGWIVSPIGQPMGQVDTQLIMMLVSSDVCRFDADDDEDDHEAVGNEKGLPLVPNIFLSDQMCMCVPIFAGGM